MHDADTAALDHRRTAGPGSHDTAICRRIVAVPASAMNSEA